MSLDIQVGDTVQEGQAIGMMEAMKVEFSLTARRSGVVQVLVAKPGEVIHKENILAIMQNLR